MAHSRNSTSSAIIAAVQDTKKFISNNSTYRSNGLVCLPVTSCRISHWLCCDDRVVVVVS